MRISIVLSTTLLQILFTGLICAQRAPEFGSKEYARNFAIDYGIASLKTPYRASGEKEIETLQSVGKWMQERFDLRSVDPPTRTGKVREIRRSFGVDSIDTEISVTQYQVSIAIWITDTFEAAGDLAAYYLSQRQIFFEKGSFSGSPVGDWTASLHEGPFGANLVFLRKNAFVRVGFNGPFEVQKSDRSRRRIRDASLRQKCEDLARDIDAELLKLPVAGKEMK